MIDEKLMLAFLNSAKPTQTGSPGYMSMLYSDGVDIFATDGSRMHVAKNVFWSEGFYTSKGERCGEQDYKHPDFERGIPEARRLTDLNTVELEECEVVAKEDGRKIVQLQDCPARFDKKFLAQAVRPMLAPKYKIYSFSISQMPAMKSFSTVRGKGGTLLIEDEDSDTLAVVMGVRHAVDS